MQIVGEIALQNLLAFLDDVLIWFVGLPSPYIYLGQIRSIYLAGWQMPYFIQYIFPLDRCCCHIGHTLEFSRIIQ